jgi:hypothetical protein
VTGFVPETTLSTTSFPPGSTQTMKTDEKKMDEVDDYKKTNNCSDGVI